MWLSSLLFLDFKAQANKWKQQLQAVEETNWIGDWSVDFNSVTVLAFKALNLWFIAIYIQYQCQNLWYTKTQTTSKPFTYLGYLWWREKFNTSVQACWCCGLITFITLGMWSVKFILLQYNCVCPIFQILCLKLIYQRTWKGGLVWTRQYFDEIYKQ